MHHTYVHHGHMYQDQEHIYASHMHTNIRVKNHTYMDASGSRSRIIDMCIIHACIRVKDRGTLINASYMHVSGPMIMHHTHMHHSQVSGSRTYICIAHAYMHQGQESYIHACFRIKVQNHRYMHHTHIHKSQGPVP